MLQICLRFASSSSADGMLRECKGNKWSEKYGREIPAHRGDAPYRDASDERGLQIGRPYCLQAKENAVFVDSEWDIPLLVFLFFDVVANLFESSDEGIVIGLFRVVDDGHFLVRHRSDDFFHALDKADVFLDFGFAAHAMHFRAGADGQSVCFMLLGNNVQRGK